MRKFLRGMVDVYILINVAPMVIGGAVVLAETALNGLDNTIKLLRENRIEKNLKDKA